MSTEPETPAAAAPDSEQAAPWLPNGLASGVVIGGIAHIFLSHAYAISTQELLGWSALHQAFIWRLLNEKTFGWYNWAGVALGITLTRIWDLNWRDKNHSAARLAFWVGLGATAVSLYGALTIIYIAASNQALFQSLVYGRAGPPAGTRGFPFAQVVGMALVANPTLQASLLLLFWAIRQPRAVRNP